MNKAVGLNLVLSPDFFQAAAMVSLLSVLVLVCLFFYLNRYTGRKYFSTWTVGWLFYALWLASGPGLHASPTQLLVKHSCVGMAAVLLFWGSAQFLKVPTRPLLFGLFAGFLLLWSYVGAFYLHDPLQIRAPIFGVIGLASILTSFSFYRLRKHREYLGAGLLSFGFLLWGIYLGVCPFFAGDNQLAGAGLLVSTVLQLFIAVSMIVLVLEEARAANEMILQQIRAFQWETKGMEARMERAQLEYQGLFDESCLSEKLRLAYEDLRLAQEKGLQRERLQALGQMSRGISHDINNALTPILGYSNLLLRGACELPETALTYIRSIKTAGEKIERSVTCIRDFYRTTESGEALVVVDLNSLTEETAREMRAQLQQMPRTPGSEIKFATNFDSGMPQIKGRKNELREALREMILNSADAMPEGGTLTLRTGFRLAKAVKVNEAPEDLAFLEIEDTGIGMDEETRMRCLEPFFSTKGQQGAKGLGLSKVFGVIERHKGLIEMESAPGEGTLMRVVFPVPPEGSAPPITPAISAGMSRRLKILCIDDEPTILEVLRVILSSVGHEVETASDGETGVEKFRVATMFNHPFDVVVTDLGMPGMDGQQTAKTIKGESAETPVVMLTGWGSIMQAEGRRPENVDAVLSKPPQVKELIEALRSVTEKSVAA
jgi:signal transduction histidine kinase/ActR/RegA family two-component response regulator